jgi:DNA polymerase/3'-5' exonuclease PolX
VDIKSESEVEEERRLVEEELAHGREALAEFPGVGLQMIERLVEYGLFSPGRIVQAGLKALEAVPGLGEKKAAGILAAAQEWIEQHPRVDPAPEAVEEVPGDALSAADDVPPAEQVPVAEGPPESVARTSAE